MAISSTFWARPSKMVMSWRWWWPIMVRTRWPIKSRRWRGPSIPRRRRWRGPPIPRRRWWRTPINAPWIIIVPRAIVIIIFSNVWLAWTYGY